MILLAGNARAGGPDPVGAALQRSYIWTQPDGRSTNETLHAGFRRSFDLAAAPQAAQLHLFAYTRYQLFVNGEYIGRGPNRFENRRPEYDSWELTSHLHAGKNVLAVLVHRDWAGVRPLSTGQTLSRFRQHEPGFTARLDWVMADKTNGHLDTDAAWRGFAETGYGPPLAHSYSSIPESYDAQASPGEWRATAFDDASLPPAMRVATEDLKHWPVLSPRTIPRLRESDVAFSTNPKRLGGPLTNEETLTLVCPRIVQAYWVLDLTAEAGTKLVVTPELPEQHHGVPSVYRCRPGPQRWMSGDTFAFSQLRVQVAAGRVSQLQARLVEVLYPFDRVGSFASSDPFLDQVWQLTARSLELLSEDAYTDCADRERSEWMDCDPPMYDATRVMMAGPGANGTELWGDPRLFANMLRRVALTQEPDGMLRARTCSELLDIHTRMEDRACDWVDGLRTYYEATGDKQLIRELWPCCQRLLKWFASHRTADGLVRAREWIAWDNPMSYATCEGAANNAFFQRAFANGAWLAGEIGNESAAIQWRAAAEKLQSDFNRLLWNDTAGAYYSAVGTPEVLPADRRFKKNITLKSIDGRTEPTLHANLFALDRGLVPPERRERVVQWTLQHEQQIRQVMANYYYFKILYRQDQPQDDQIVLDRIRRGWQAMVASPWQTTWESMGGGSKVHCYGIVPGYFLSAYVLGVRREAPVWQHQIIIEPHLADLTHAEGLVVTEFGPVPVAWNRTNGGLHFSLRIPAGTVARLALPAQPDRAQATLNGQVVNGSREGSRWVTNLKSGTYEGVY